MKQILTLLFLSFIGALTWAAPRTQQQAHRLATEALSRQLGHNVKLMMRDAQKSAPLRDAEAEATAPYYHFLTDDRRAFVVIAGSDLLPAVIGYGQSEEQISMTDSLPLNMQEWLEQVAEAEAHLEANPAAAEAEAQARSLASALTPIQPLMKCKWGQDFPYNNLCPKQGNGSHTVTGCVATALSQIIYTQRFPAASVGQVEYKNGNATLKADLNGVTYDYDLMFDSYSSKCTSAQTQEVAKLCSNVGLACQMQYGPSSGTISPFAHDAAVSHFGMTKASFLKRLFYSYDEWTGIVRQQMEQGNPVMMMGQSDEGGHAFVLHGMDKQGFYLVNWGWNGYYDGYYDISILRTDGTGIGATTNNGFSLDQEIMINLCDPQRVDSWPIPVTPYYAEDNPDILGLFCDYTAPLTKGSDIALGCHLFNWGIPPTSFRYGIVVERDGKVYDRQMSNELICIDGCEMERGQWGGYYVNPGYFGAQISYTIPTDIPDGTYQLWMCIQPEGSEDFSLVHQLPTRELSDYWTLTVKGDDLQLAYINKPLPYEASDWSMEGQEMTTGPTDISVRVCNNGNDTRVTFYSLILIQPDGNKQQTSMADNNSDPITLAPGESKELSFHINLTQSGKWTAAIMARDHGYDSASPRNFGICDFMVKPDDTRDAVFTLLKAPINLSGDVTNGGDLSMQLNLKNTGSTFTGRIGIRLFTSRTATSDAVFAAEIMQEDIRIEANTTTEVTITGPVSIPNLTAAQTLYARCYIQYGSEMKQPGVATLVVNRTNVNIVPETDSAIGEVRPDVPDAAEADVRDVLGHKINIPASGLRPGIYIINGKKRVIKGE